MERLKNIAIILFVAVGILSTLSFAKSSGTLLQEGLYAEQVDGDLDAAIKIYEKIIEDSSTQRSHIAQASHRQGMCYLKKQNEPKAKEVFGKLVANYSNQTKVVNKVKPMLEELGNADPAALMPPETLIYIEGTWYGKEQDQIYL
jgi:tetratricopeptide (TPR) repeat protein